MFREFTLLCKEWDLFGKEILAVDGSKFRASNSKHKNFTQKKLERKLREIDEKIENYMQELDKNDREEANVHVPDKEEIQKRIEELEKRKKDYTDLKEQMKETGAAEISTVDPDARLMAVNNNGLEVSYNVQLVVDHKHKLIVDSEVINNPSDQGQLSNMAKRGKEILEVDSIKVLADKGYYCTNDLTECEKNQIEAYVAKQRFTGSIANEEFQPDKFRYNEKEDTYICPAGEVLYPGRIRQDRGVKYKVYKNKRACEKCSLRDKCTKSKSGRTIHRNLVQPFLDEIDRRTRENKSLYEQRKMIVEHPFGTIKRIWGYSYFLTRGLVSVNAENKLHLLAYNLKRVINILGVEEIIRRLPLAK